MTEEEKKGDDAAGEEGQAAPAKASKEVVQIKPGDYTVHLLLQKAKDLSIDADDSMNVVCEVTVSDKKETTKVMENVTSTTIVNFDSHIFIELMGKSVAELEQTKILIKLQEKGFFNTSLIGQVELDLTFLYNLENHTKQHQWFALINPDSEDFSAVSAYLKISGSVYGIDDTPIELKMDENDDDDNCVMPPSLKPKYTQLKMHIVKGEHLPKLDVKMIGEGCMDAFITAKIGGKTIRTEIKQTVKDEATWNQTLLIPVRMPIMSGKLILNVMDLDNVKDEQAGALIFDYKDLLARDQRSFFWANIYGAPGGEGLIASGGKKADEMNKDPTIATKWKGRILIGIEHEETESPKLGVESMSTLPPNDAEGNPIPGLKSIVEDSQAAQKMNQFLLMYEFSQCLNIPENLGKYNLQFKIAEKEFHSEGGDARVVGYNYNRWLGQRTKTPEVLELPYKSVEDIGEIFIYLCPDKGGIGGVFNRGGGSSIGDPIAYAKLNAADFQDPNPQLKWVELQAEPIEDKIKSPELAGIIAFRLSLVKAEANIDFSQQTNWTKRIKKRCESAKIRCYLFQCKDLPAADEDGASDPLVVAYSTIDEDTKDAKRMKAAVVETDVIENNCDPMFYQLLEIKIDYVKDEPLPPFIFDIYDVDKKFIGEDTRDYIGRCVVNEEDCAYLNITEEEDSVDLRPPIPKWHPIRYSQNSSKAGEILVSFIRPKDFDHEWKVPDSEVKMVGINDDSAVVRFDEYRVELNVLGLRGLVSPGLLPVKKAYIDFLLKSMVPPVASSALSSVSTVPGPTGPDPTINSVISFSVPMPINPLFAPSMSCRVYDKVFKGMSGQLIGVFSIPIGDIMQNQAKEYEENLAALDHIISQLKEALTQPVVLDYDPVNKANGKKLVNDKNFRENQRKQKQIQQKAMDKPSSTQKNKSLSSTIANKIAPKQEKPTKTLQNHLISQQKDSMKKRLILNVDEDSDSEGETFTNPVAKADTEASKYQPPDLNIAAINDSKVHDVDALAKTPRSQLSSEEKKVLDREAVLDALAEKHDPDKLKNLTPKAGQAFKPPAATRITTQDVENAIRQRSGANTPQNAEANLSVKQFTPTKTGMSTQLLKMAKAEEDAISRATDDERKIAQKEMNAKNGGKEIRMIEMPQYEMDERLGCMRECNMPPAILYESLGWDRDPGVSKEKHYRKFTPIELEKEKSIMSKESEFSCFTLKRGQQRGASGGGDEDTTTKMGLFKALITVTHKDTEMQTKMAITDRLTQIRDLLRQIYEKRHPKHDFPIPTGFFCEDTLTGSKILNANQRERTYSDDIKATKSQLQTFGDQIEQQQRRQSKRLNNNPLNASHKSNRSSCNEYKFDDKSSTILNQEGRMMFRELMKSMRLSHLQILRKVVDVQSDEIIKRLLMQETKTNVRVYIVRAFNLAARDSDSPSDPFVKVILGDDERSDRDNHQTDEASPDIHKMYEFQAVFPGCPLLKVQFWDYDLLFGDDFIGETIVDLEDRYFNSDFRSVQNKPIEHRRLSHPSTEMSQGTVVMWAEINEQYAGSQSSVVTYDISKKPSEDYQVRVIVWDTEELKMMDAEGTTDGFVRCFFESDESKDTDTHFRNSDGKCSWNYRMLFPFTHPCKNYKLKVQAYDLDLFKSNDLIGETTVDLETMFEDSELAKRPMSLTADYYEEFLKPEKKMSGLTFDKEDPRKFWVDLISKDEKGKKVVHGRLKLSIDIMPKKDADLNPVGEAQSEPNCNPFLPKPFGRIEFSMNPLKMLNQLIGPALRRKLYCYCCLAICCALCIMMAPMIMSNIFVNIITPG